MKIKKRYDDIERKINIINLLYFQFSMKFLKSEYFNFGLFTLVIFFSLAGCREDDNGDTPEQETVAGIYSFKSATFENDVEIKLNGKDTTFTASSDATPFVNAALLGEAPCNDAGNATLELRESGDLFFVCQGENNEAQAGTWDLNEAGTQIRLKVINPAPFTLLIENYKLENKILSGRISNFPLVKDSQYKLGAPLPQGGINAQTTPVDIQLAKVN